VGLDAAWATVLVAAEAAALRQATTCLRAPGRYSARRDEVQQSVEDGYSYTLTPRLSSVVQRVFDRRRPERETEDGVVPAEPIADVLASADLYDECDELVDALRETVDARWCSRRCVVIQVAEGVAVLVIMLLLPVALWPPLTDDHLVTGSLLHVSNTVLGIAAVAATVLFFAAIWADNAFDKALVQHKPRRERIG
jgi:hypothetical protein